MIRAVLTQDVVCWHGVVITPPTLARPDTQANYLRCASAKDNRETPVNPVPPDIVLSPSIQGPPRHTNVLSSLRVFAKITIIPMERNQQPPRPPRFQCCEGWSQCECARLRNKRLNSYANTGSCTTLNSGDMGGHPQQGFSVNRFNRFFRKHPSQICLY